MAPTIEDSNGEKDIKWTDAQIRWPEDKVDGDDNDDNDNFNDGNPFDPFADPDPTEIFKFRFVTKQKQKTDAKEEPIQREDTSENDNDDDKSIRLEIHGYKTDSDQVWESTGLTLWKASKYLCDYMVDHANELRGQRVLEVSGVATNRIAPFVVWCFLLLKIWLCFEYFTILFSNKKLFLLVGCI